MVILTRTLFIYLPVEAIKVIAVLLFLVLCGVGLVDPFELIAPSATAQSGSTQPR